MGSQLQMRGAIPIHLHRIQLEVEGQLISEINLLY